jgi:hypothetical protein
MHRSLTLLAVLLLTISAACGGPGASTGGDGNGGDESEAAVASASTEASVEASTEASQDDGNGDGGPAEGDLEQLVEDLTPPNSTEISRTEAAGGIVVAFNSTDSAESLEGHYEGAITATGMEIFSRSTVSGTFSWVFAESEGSSYGGSVTVGPATDGSDGSSVIIAVTGEGT